jgi:AbrB family looped-hinge helix DNA binding protein
VADLALASRGRQQARKVGISSITHGRNLHTFAMLRGVVFGFILTACTADQLLGRETTTQRDGRYILTDLRSGAPLRRRLRACRSSPQTTSSIPARRGVPRHAWYTDAMRTTIDKAGRVVIPAALRERAGLAPGSELEITEDELGIRLTRTAAGPRLVKVGRRLVARPTVAASDRPSVDIAALIEEERNRWP